MRRLGLALLTALAATAFLLAMVASGAPEASAATKAVLVKDLNPGDGGSNPSVLTDVNGTLFFRADDGIHGAEVWKSKVTGRAPTLVEDINPGAGSSCPLDQEGDPDCAFGFTNVDGTAIFAANDGTTGSELWRSNGTGASTTLVRDINPGTSGAIPGYVPSANLITVNGTVFFVASDGIHGFELWKSDGTAGGTTLVKDINPGADSSDPEELTNVNGTLFFSARDRTSGLALWKSDGTAAGTTLVKNIDPVLLTNVNGTLFFRADDGTSGLELWKSDGSVAGTTLVKDINPGGGYEGSSIPNFLTDADGTLFFSADDGIHGSELWKSDGTSAGTTLVKDVNTGVGYPVGNPGSSFPNALTNVNGTLFFNADDGIHGFELWKSDGTAAGTTLVKDIASGTAGSWPGGFGYGDFYPGAATNVSGTLFFSADDGIHGRELWKSDGSAAGTTLVKDIKPGGGYDRSSFPFGLTNVSGTLFFSADDGVHGYELWKTRPRVR
jgi:ELWxxDGT repeat protein